ncbi:hypothetical protein AVEN_77415-1 [Araneus ventricosus]|uniref:Uncharacterized protein n=1 Tax=Araneus ventricosus TaxID=182803 RepID=A0A4Y2C8E7_ARAVE|nr:hypothetical protein AVEN_77415-1 [Araneus ventricosus]
MLPPLEVITLAVYASVVFQHTPLNVPEVYIASPAQRAAYTTRSVSESTARGELCLRYTTASRMLGPESTFSSSVYVPPAYISRGEYRKVSYRWTLLLAIDDC